MGKVTAVGMDVITETSGHTVAPQAPSVCLTPPGPAPVPYPVTGSSSEGITGAPSRTKIAGARAATVGSALKVCHGNEPGTAKEVVSLTTGGPVPLLAGAPNVFIELGQVGITGSPGLANRGVGPGMRTAPSPAAGPGSVPCVIIAGGGGGSGDGDGSGHGKGDGAGGAGSGDSAGSAPAGKTGQCAAGEPVDVITGRVYTLAIVDVDLPGPLPFQFSRRYSSTATGRDVGLGPGWAHSLSWSLEVRAHRIRVWDDQGLPSDFPVLGIGAEHVGAWGWALRRDADHYVLDTGEDRERVFSEAPRAPGRWRLSEERDRNGNRIVLAYDPEGRLVGATDSAHRRILFNLGLEGHVEAVSVKARRSFLATARFRYDGQGHLVEAADADGYARKYTYDNGGLLTSHTDREGVTFHYRYDGEGRCVESWGDGAGVDESLSEGVPELLADRRTRARGVHHVRLDYGPGLYTEVVDSTEVRRYQGNAQGLVDRATGAAGTDESVYDRRGLIVAHADRAGNVTRYERDERSRLLRVIAPLDRVTTYERDEHGFVIRIIDPAGGVYELPRDERGNVLAERDPTGATWSYTYDDRGLVLIATSPTGHNTVFAYSGDGSLRERLDPGGRRWRWTYDALGRLSTEIDPLGNVTRFAWSARGDLVRMDGPGSSRRFVYDGEQRVVHVEDSGERVTRYAWGGYGRLVQATDANGGAVRLRYNREGEALEVRNELGERHRVGRDNAGRITAEQTVDGRVLFFRRDALGLVNRYQGGPTTIDFEHDASGALVRRELDDRAEDFTYNARGELVRVAWPEGAVSFERDAAGRVVREVQTYRGETHAVSVEYDASGARRRRTTTAGLTEEIERNGSGERTRTILDGEQEVAHEVDLLGREVWRTLPKGGRIGHAYDREGRLVRRWVTSPSERGRVRVEDPAWTSAATPAQPPQVTVEHEFKYSEASELSDTRDRERGWQWYEYDAGGNMVASVGESTGRHEWFAYDAAGNPTEASESGVPLGARVYLAGGRLLRQGATVYAWTETGCLYEKRTTRDDGSVAVHRYTWDAGRLAAVELPDGRRIAYAYDPFGRRLEAAVSLAEPGALPRLVERTRYVWDGDVLVHEIRHRMRDGAEPVMEVRTFAFEDDSFVPWAQCDDVPDPFGGRRRTWGFFVNDPNGSPDELVAGAGAVVALFDRKAWGEAHVVSGHAYSPIRYQGQYADEDTGLHYNRHRYYDPTTGLYLSPDPIGLAGGLRPYGYGRNPTAWVDPLGLLPNLGAMSRTELDAHMRARAQRLQGRNPEDSQGFRTTAVGLIEGPNGRRLVFASSSNRSCPEQHRSAGRGGEQRIVGPEKHAEQILMNNTPLGSGEKLTTIAASRPACGPERADCRGKMRAAGIRMLDP